MKLRDILILVGFFVVGCIICSIGYNMNSNAIQYVGGAVIVLPWIGFLLYNKYKQIK